MEQIIESAGTADGV